jgi:pyruvate/2-oxoglutarate dehydrogenase complex dihydrolipoamide dehydrogenase (E3) component
VPQVVFTEPEIAAVGLTAATAGSALRAGGWYGAPAFGSANAQANLAQHNGKG